MEFERVVIAMDYIKLARWPALIARLDLIKLSLYMTRYSSF
jgi:hypothetical protein